MVETPENLGWTSENVKKTFDNSSSMIRLIMPCPLSRAFDRSGGACKCPVKEVAWFHQRCGEPDYVDHMGNVHCSAGCPNNCRPIFSCNFICETNKDKLGQFRAHHIMKTIMAMRTNACAAADEGGLDDDDSMLLIDWCQALEKNL